jgi:hypothetical protein
MNGLVPVGRADDFGLVALLITEKPPRLAAIHFALLLKLTAVEPVRAVAVADDDELGRAAHDRARLPARRLVAAANLKPVQFVHDLAAPVHDPAQDGGCGLRHPLGGAHATGNDLLADAPAKLG